MDPATIVALSLAVVKSCKTVYKAFEAITLADTTIDALRKEIKALTGTLEGIRENFDDPSLAQTLVSVKGGHWGNMDDAMKDCTEIFKRLGGLIGSTSSNRGMIGRSWDQLKTALKSGEIALLQKQISSNRTIIELSLNMIMLYKPLI
jgi:hypothetical protein